MTDGYKVKRGLIRVNGVEKQFYPATWHPGSNTIAYYPLTSASTVNDMSGNNHNLTNQNVTFGTYQGVNCGYFNARGSSTGYCGLVNSSFYPRVSSSLPLTVNVWFYASGNTTYNNPRIAEPIVWAKDYGNKIIAGWYNNGNINGAPFNIGEWTNVCFILTDSNHYTVYKNGVQQYANVYTASVVSSSRYFTMGTRSDNGTQYGDKWDGGISNFILENKARTAQEVSDYYNLTKSNYGL